MFRASMCSSSGGNYFIYATLVFVTLVCLLDSIQPTVHTPPIQNNKYKCRIDTVISSWWWAHGCPKHVKKRNKYIKQNCAPSWTFWLTCKTRLTVLILSMRESELKFTFLYPVTLPAAKCEGLKAVAYRGGLRVQPPKISKFWQSRTGLQIGRKMLFSYSNILINIKIAEFRTPTPLRCSEKKGSKILKLLRFPIVLHLQWQINWLSS